MFDYDAEIRRYNEPFRIATGVKAGDRVLDVGCGAGQSTRDAARVGESALGVDLSEAMLEEARSVEESVGNVSFELADAQRHPFPGNHFDVVISRFGTMFFADPVAAFGNLARALRPEGRLAMLVWQAAEEQEWAITIRDALKAGPAGNAAFSLAEPETVQGILDAAGFRSVAHQELREPVYYGPDAGAAAEAVLGLRIV